MNRHRTAAVAGGFAVVVALGLLGCADDGNDDPEALPAPERSAFTQGEFDDIPVFRAATPVQGPTERDGTIAASYQTDTAVPQTVIQFYENALPDTGWQLVDPVRETSDGVWRADWVRDDRRLQVVPSPFPPPEEVLREDVTNTQFSLVLLDDTADIPVATPPS